MSTASFAPWPPPPDIESIQELVREADIEGLIAIQGAPADEYEPEGVQVLAAIKHLPSAQMTALTLFPILEEVWSKNLIVDESERDLRRVALKGLAEQIARFFGPEAEPQTR